MDDTYVFGLLAARCSHGERKHWNALLLEHGIHGFFDFYRTEDARDLELRLSEMFHHGRRAYILSRPLRLPVRPLLDRIDASASKEVDTVINHGGILVGYRMGDKDPLEQVQVWIARSSAGFSD